DEVFSGYRDILELDFCFLGICFGHQLIADAFGGRVRMGLKGEYAQAQIKLLGDDVLFDGLPDRFTAWTSHKDEVVDVPQKFRVLAESKDCEIEAMRHESRPIWGVQFHPEVHHTTKGSVILKNFAEACINWK
ncbi:MAG: GMP synthase, partial [Candidatus Altiarchaeales archaeon]|nr:GMP synthase [Candidatus Altiarchaeales archaeon]